MLEMLMNIGGFMVVNWINYGLSFVGGAIDWRLPIALQMVFILILFATVPWLPESPRYGPPLSRLFSRTEYLLKFSLIQMAHGSRPRS